MFRRVFPNFLLISIFFGTAAFGKNAPEVPSKPFLDEIKADFCFDDFNPKSKTIERINEDVKKVRVYRSPTESRNVFEYFIMPRKGCTIRLFATAFQSRSILGDITSVVRDAGGDFSFASIFPNVFESFETFGRNSVLEKCGKMPDENASEEARNNFHNCNAKEFTLAVGFDEYLWFQAAEFVGSEPDFDKIEFFLTFRKGRLSGVAAREYRSDPSKEYSIQKVILDERIR